MSHSPYRKHSTLNSPQSGQQRGDLSQYFLQNLEPASQPVSQQALLCTFHHPDLDLVVVLGLQTGLPRPARPQTTNDRNYFLLVRNLQTGQQPIINQKISYQRQKIFQDESELIIAQCDSVTV